MIHLVDVLFAAAVTFLTTGSSRPFFVFFVFVLFVASVRLRMTGILVAAAAILVLFLSGPLTIVFATVAERAMVPPQTMIETGYGKLHTGARVHRDSDAGDARRYGGGITTRTPPAPHRPLRKHCAQSWTSV